MSAARRRVLVVVGTRPEAIKLAPLVHALRAESWVECRLLATGQHRQLLDQMLAYFDLVPDFDLDLMRAEQTPATLAARMMDTLDPVLAKDCPDMVVAQGDTSTAMVAALCAYYRRIRFAHVEAGLRTGNKWRPFPEEGHRAMLATLTDLHFAPTEQARRNLLAENIAPQRIHLVGNTVVDALQWTLRRIDDTAFRPAPGKKLVLVTAHRRENHGAPLQRICDALATISGRPDVEVLFPVHPGPAVGQVVRRKLSGLPNLRLCGPLGYPEMVAAMRAATLILTDSGGIQEEATTLRRPTLVLRDDTERPEAVAAGHACVVGTDAARIVAAAAEMLDRPVAAATDLPGSNPFGDGNSAIAIVRVLREMLA